MAKERKVSLFVVICCVIMSLYALITLGILLWGLLTSLKSSSDYSLLGNKLGLPHFEASAKEFFRLENYRLIFNGFQFKREARYYSGSTLIVHKVEVGFWDMILNSFVYAGLGCFLRAFTPCLVAYLVVKYPNVLSKVIYNVAMVVMIIPVVGSATSTVAVLRAIGLFDTLVGGMVLNCSFSGMYFFVFCAFFKGLSDGYIEAAEIDGAGQVRTFFSIVVPLASKTLASIMLLQFIAIWNDYQTPLMYMPTLPTISYGVFYMTMLQPSGILSKFPIKIAGCMLLAIPLLIIFLLLRNKLMGNISMGGIKE